MTRGELGVKPAHVLVTLQRILTHIQRRLGKLFAKDVTVEGDEEVLPQRQASQVGEGVEKHPGCSVVILLFQKDRSFRE